MIDTIALLLHVIINIMSNDYFHVNCIYDWDENDVQCFDCRDIYPLWVVGFRVNEDVPTDLLETVLHDLLNKHKGNIALVRGGIDVYNVFPNETSIYWTVYLM